MIFPNIYLFLFLIVPDRNIQQSLGQSFDYKVIEQVEKEHYTSFVFKFKMFQFTLNNDYSSELNFHHKSHSLTNLVLFAIPKYTLKVKYLFFPNN